MGCSSLPLQPPAPGAARGPQAHGGPGFHLAPEPAESPRAVDHADRPPRSGPGSGFPVTLQPLSSSPAGMARGR